MPLLALTFSSFLSPAFCPHSLLCKAGVIWEESLVHFSCSTTNVAIDCAGNCLWYIFTETVTCKRVNQRLEASAWGVP